MIIGNRYKDFPPGWGHLKIPTSSRAAALAGLALYAPCKRRAIWAQRAAWLAVQLVGPACLPGQSRVWRPPLEPGSWDALLETLRSRLGKFDAIAGYQRLQVSRPGFALLLLRQDQPIAFVKLRQGPGTPFVNEARAQAEVWRFGPRSFSVTEPFGVGEACGWHYFAVGALPPRLHRPPHDPPLSTILAEIGQALAGLPMTPDTPAHWRPMHGDFTPWNLRSVGKALCLIDWEDAAWAPPGADEVLYRASRAALRGRVTDFQAPMETLLFWEQRVERWRTNKRDDQFRDALRQALRGMRVGTSTA
jgi:hypothetical protein